MLVVHSWTETVQVSPHHPVPTMLLERHVLKAVLVRLGSDQVLPEHPAPPAVFHVLDGSGIVTADGVPAEVGAGALITVPFGARRGWRAATRLDALGALGDPTTG